MVRHLLHKLSLFFSRRQRRLIHVRPYMVVMLVVSPLFIAYNLLALLPVIGLHGIILLIGVGSFAFDLVLFILSSRRGPKD